MFSLYSRHPSFEIFSSASRRLVSTHGAIINELSNKNLPKSIGYGPFVEIPKYKLLGNHSDLINITLPRGSKVNIKSGTVIALNGDLDDFRAMPRVMYNTRYQEFSAYSAASIIASGNQNNYWIIDVSTHNEKWTIYDDKSLVAWNGIDFNLVPTKLFEKLKSFESRGKGSMLFGSESSIYELNLEENDIVITSPSCVIASNVTANNVNLNNSWRMTDYLRLNPVFRIITSYLIKLRKLTSEALCRLKPHFQQIPYINVVTNACFKFTNSIRLSIINKIFEKPIYWKLSGPGRVLLSNSTALPNSRIFTKKEIDRAIKL